MAVPTKVWLAAVLGLAIGGNRPTPLAGQARRFILYEKGIKTATVDEAGVGVERYRVDRRDRFTGRWSGPIGVLRDSLTRGSAALPGSLQAFGRISGRLPPALGRNTRIVQIALDSLPVLELVRDHEVRALVRGRQVAGQYWAQKDAGVLRYGFPPLDLILGADRRVLAAVDPSNDNVLVLEGLEALTPTFERWRHRDARTTLYGIRMPTRMMVAMSDGVRLATDVYLPDDGRPNGRYPVIFDRTPYDARPVINNAWSHVARGYALVVQDVRGRYGSEGQFLNDINELKDGDESLTWIAKQAWCNGKIGMMGASYPGHAQWMAAYRGNPALKALVPVVSMGTPHNDMPYAGGALGVGGAAWTFGMEGGSQQRTDWDQLLRTRPFKDIDLRGLGRESALWNQVAEHQLYDDYWKEADWVRYQKNIDVPALHISGWYDDDHPGTLANWAMMARNRRAHQRLILGGWRHSVNRDREINGVKFGVGVVRADLQFLMQQWYDRFLVGIPNGIDRRPVVEYFSVGDNTWRTATSWPPADVRYENWYLRGDGGAASEKTGRLSRIPPGDEPPDRYRYDPENPTPSLINVSYNEQSLPDDYAQVELRPDVAVFQSEPLEQPVRIAGTISAVLYASSSAKDTDWIVRLSDVDPKGRANRLVEGVRRARHRRSLEREELLTPGVIERYEVGMRSHATSFRPGHRIRISVSSAAAGYIYPNSNTGENEATVTRTVVADQALHHDRAHMSFVRLPVVPFQPAGARPR